MISKLKKNQPLTEKDVDELEKILWSELGTKEDYEAEFGRKPLGEFIREMVGLDMNAAKEAFSKYLEDVSLDSRQIYFVNQIIEYIVHNGMMKDLSVLLESPFTDRGSISEIFTDMSVWLGIKKSLIRSTEMQQHKLHLCKVEKILPGFTINLTINPVDKTRPGTL